MDSVTMDCKHINAIVGAAECACFRVVVLAEVASQALEYYGLAVGVAARLRGIGCEADG